MTTELVVAFPVLILLTFAPVHFALYWHARQVADLAASEALDNAIVLGASDSDAKAAAINVIAATGQLEGAVVTIVRPNPDDIVVTVTGQPRFRIFPGDWSVRSETQGRAERFLGEDER